MLDELGWLPLPQTRQEARLILFYKIINGFVEVPFDGVQRFSDFCQSGVVILVPN